MPAAGQRGGNADRAGEVDRVHHEFDDPGAQVLVEPDAHPADRDDAVIRLRGDERSGPLDRLRHLADRIRAEPGPCFDPSRLDRGVVGELLEHRVVVRLGARDGDLTGFVLSEVALDREDGARGVAGEAPHIP
jgi:hypothetical protein